MIRSFDEPDPEPGSGRPQRTGPRKRKQPKKVSLPYLRRVAHWYVERWFGTQHSLRQTLIKRVVRAVRVHDQDRETLDEWVEEVVQEFVEARLIDDLAWARDTAQRAHQRGSSTRQIRQKLAVKRIDREMIDEVLTELAADLPADPDQVAAARYARRRRFGPYRLPEKRADRRDKDIAAMARAGFNYSLAKWAIDQDDTEELDELVFASRGW